jgi:hypothetical protein
LGEYVILTDSLFKEISKSPKKMDSVYWLPSEDIVLWRTRSISKDAVKDGTYFTGQDQIDTVVIRKKTIGLFVPDIKSNNLLNFVFDEDI